MRRTPSPYIPLWLTRCVAGLAASLTRPTYDDGPPTLPNEPRGGYFNAGGPTTPLKPQGDPFEGALRLASSEDDRLIHWAPFAAAIDDARSPSVDLSVGCQVEILEVRTRVRVRKATSSNCCRLAPPARRAPKRSMTRMVPLGVDGTVEEEKNPFDDGVYLEGLRMAGYLEPLDVSRKTIKSRFTHGLQKEEVRKQSISVAGWTDIPASSSRRTSKLSSSKRV